MRSTHWIRPALLALILAPSAAFVSADDKNLADLTIEELMNETITSVSKKAEKLSDAAAAISVLSNDDIRRSGATTIPDTLRLVPGMDVGTLNSQNWAISARGFNGAYANKLLPLMDGRSLYDPIFSGAFWNIQQTLLEDIDRIEVIRGPGGTIWGANAVNGIVNIVTRSAKDTQGGLITFGAGDVVRSMGALRYGGQIGETTYYRVYADSISTGDYPLANGQSADDHWSSRQFGFRMDSYPDTATHATLQGDLTQVKWGNQPSDIYNANVLGRWSRELSERSNAEVQAYIERNYDDEPIGSYASDIVDVTVQQTMGIGEHNDVIWGIGYRFTSTHARRGSPEVPRRNNHLLRERIFSAFVQDEFKIVPDKLVLIAGAKIERNDYTGFEIQPSLRATFKPTQSQTVWAAVSRAVRTPDDVEAADLFGAVVGPPFAGPGGGLYVPTLTGNGSPKAETVLDYELGYRAQLTNSISVDLTGFYSEYRNLISVPSVPNFVPGVPLGVAELPWANILSAESHGAEASVVVAATDAWRLTLGYSFIRQLVSGPTQASTLTQQPPPEHQVLLRSSYDFSRQASFDVQARYVGSIPSVPSYLTADVHLSYRPSDKVELSLVGQNLLDPHHPEQGPSPILGTTDAPREFYGKITWHFR